METWKSNVEKFTEELKQFIYNTRDDEVSGSAEHKIFKEIDRLVDDNLRGRINKWKH